MSYTTIAIISAGMTALWFWAAYSTARRGRLAGREQNVRTILPLGYWVGVGLFVLFGVGTAYQCVRAVYYLLIEQGVAFSASLW